MSNRPHSQAIVYLTDEERRWLERSTQRAGVAQTDVLRLGLTRLMHTTGNRGRTWLDDELQEMKNRRRCRRTDNDRPRLKIIAS